MQESGEAMADRLKPTNAAARLLELATRGVQERHWDAIGEASINHPTTHRDPIQTCPHTDCLFVRAFAAAMPASADNVIFCETCRDLHAADAAHIGELQAELSAIEKDRDDKQTALEMAEHELAKPRLCEGCRIDLDSLHEPEVVPASAPDAPTADTMLLRAAINGWRWEGHWCGSCGRNYSQCRVCKTGTLISGIPSTQGQCGGHEDIACASTCIATRALAEVERLAAIPGKR